MNVNKSALAVITVKKCAKVARNVIQRLLVLALQKTGRIDFPVPPNSLMRITAARTIGGYYESGLSCSLPIVTAALREGIDLRSNINLLEFGCGVGREILQFTRHFPNPRYFACDIDQGCIDFIKQSYTQVNAYRNDFIPPLLYDDEQFEMVYSVSVFSHLPPEDHAAWLKEFARILTPGGFCFLTVEGPSALERMADDFEIEPAQLHQRLEVNGVLYQEYRDLEAEKTHARVVRFGRKYGGVAGSYGSTVMTPTYILRKWSGNGLDVVAVLEGIIDFRQDLVVLRRPDHSHSAGS